MIIRAMFYGGSHSAITRRQINATLLGCSKLLYSINSHAHLCRKFCVGHSLLSENVPITLQNVFDDMNRDRVRRLLPTIRIPNRPGRSKEVKSLAAVLVPMCLIDGEPSILFMKRSIHLKSHSGEICFPGGMKDETDKDLIETALRETFEEIGLVKDQVEIWEQMNHLPSKRDGNWVTPVVGFCKQLDLEQLCLNKSEVENVFTVTIESICNPANQRQTQWRVPGSNGYTLPVFLIGEYRIWGLTAVILHVLMPLLVPDLYKFKLKHRR